uniref:Geraniol-10-hydroxylase n=1 Tax=Camptotheca acuminata TaxID=16922 RepID=G8E0P7_CAMAC|nr:geraniol-10-hydroxylase [Camptotheca acuminata]
MDIMDFMSFFIMFFGHLQIVSSPTTAASCKGCKKASTGPKPFPVIGNLLDVVGNQPHKSLANLAKTHGPLMTLKLGQITTVVVSSSTMAKQILQNHDLYFSNRYTRDAIRALNQDQFSVIWLPVVTRWRNLRKILNLYMLSTERLGANQPIRCQKVEELIAYVRQSCQASVSVDIGQAAFRTMINLTSKTIFSVDLADPSSDTAQELKELFWRIMEELGKPNLADYFPVLRKLDPQGIRRRTTIHFAKVFDLFDRMIDQRLELLRSDDCCTGNDLLDSLLNISQNNSDEIDQNQIKRMLMDVFIAATDTTSSTLEWAMTELLRNPETLLKAKAELQQIVGKGKLVEELDIARLPYLQAIVKETFRLHTTVPFLIPRQVDEDVEVCGFTVPKGAQVLVNAWAIGHDPSIWPKPDSFMPERFLESEVDVRGLDFELIPFGGGRRICPGSALALRMLHLMLGSLINSFDWRLEDGIAPNDMDMEEKFGLSLQKARPLLFAPVHI